MKSFIAISCIFIYTSMCSAQRLNTPTLSPISKISQEVGLTELNLSYSRPSAKERKIFGDLVPFGEVWRTGANASTKITLTEKASIGGNPIDAGTYALYTIPGEKIWTIIIHSNTKLRSIAGGAYKPENDLFRFEVVPQHIEPLVETFTIQFSNITASSCDLQLLWANTFVNIPVKVEVDQKIEDQMTEYLKDPENIPHRTYFEAAQYYLHNDKDLPKALTWIDNALEKSAKNFRYGLLKAKIQDKSGDRESAINTINQAHAWAVEASNANYIGQTELFRKELIEKK